MARSGNKLTVALLKNYITFMLITIGIFFISYVYLGFRLSEAFNKTNVPFVDIIEGTLADYKNININQLKKVDGYIEIVDSKGMVVHRDGVLGDTLKNSYTYDELLYIASLNSDSKYTVFLKTFTDNRGERLTVIIRVPNSKVNLSINLLGVPYSAGKPFYKQYIMVFGAVFIVFAINVIIYSIYTAKKIKEPLNEIDTALMKVIDGDFTAKLHLDGEEEFQVIRNTINYLTFKLNKSQEENKKLQESKNRMLLDLSHDVKTPMTTIRGFSSALCEGMIEDEEKKQVYYETINKKAERVSELIDDLFEFVRMDTVQSTLKLQSVELNELLREVVLEYYDEILEKGFSLNVDILENSIFLRLDVKLIKRALINLIENAIKYNEEGARIGISLKEDETYIEIFISDNGVGIPNSIRETLFEAFVRGDESRKTDGGSGLGLSIAKKVIENHGGEIDLLPPNDQYNTIFRIKLYKD